MALIGIDLGTTYSLVSCWRDGEPLVIPNELGDMLTPSAVSLDHDGSLLVGAAALDRLITHPDASTSQFKRLMGQKNPVKLRCRESGGKRVHKRTFRPEELSSILLKSLKADAESFLGEPVEDVIISVPAYFNDAQRKMTNFAGKLAGLNVKRLINEPTAAAIAYGLPNLERELTFLVLDLGGGTFDISVLELFDSTMEVHATSGDAFLGGIDFTKCIYRDILEASGLRGDKLSNAEKNVISKRAEGIKLALSERSQIETSLHIGKKVFDYTLTQERFEELAAPLLKKIRRPIERAVHDSRLSPGEIDSIVLVGGATRMPMFRKLITRMFGKFPTFDHDPDMIVAKGAAIQHALSQRHSSIEELVLTDICPYTMGVATSELLDASTYVDGRFTPIIERNSTVPVSREEVFWTIQDNQPVISIEVYQGESRFVANNLKLGSLEVPVPKKRAGEQSITVRFTYNVNGILEVETKVIGTGDVKRLILEESPGNLSKEEIEKSLKDLAHLKIHPKNSARNRAVMAKLERLFEESLGEEREAIGFIMHQFERILATQDLKQIEEQRVEIEAFIDEFEKNWGI
ncbi:molecular chaperone HscC [Myxococcota bacterium]|nr:molecular chaperone HscC [Myxococcota bacterium]MBU1537509.1 molecular chaperone HscC [Myxococcota bacterium]